MAILSSVAYKFGASIDGHSARRPAGLFLQKPALRAASFKSVKPGRPSHLGTFGPPVIQTTTSPGEREPDKPEVR